MAIDDLLDEHEQSERVLEWLRNNGAGLIGGIVLGLAAIGGWKWWEQDRQQQALSVADRYQTAV
ncbi:MAG: tetratricopeptide repeat protein, partial [Lysobacter spongiicola]|nr:tetratricopeptide repeat protein [Lysobacter spongiicola]